MWNIGGIAVLILNLRRSGQLHPWPPYLLRGKSPRYQANRMLGGPQSRSELFGEELILSTGLFRLHANLFWVIHVIGCHYF